MDTLEKATGLADSQLADAINREWLEESAQSSQLSNELKRFRLESSLNLQSTSSAQANLYGATTSWSRQTNGQPKSSWFGETTASFIANKTRRRNSLENGNLNSNYTINNNHLYDNISFADSPVLRSTYNSQQQHQQQKYDENEKLVASSVVDCDTGGPDSAWHCFDKFRIFLACYVLLGITLAIYSRNALSLAAVGMIASNQVNRELIGILEKTNSNNAGQLVSVSEQVYAALDGSCPVYYTKQHEQQQQQQQAALINNATQTNSIKQQLEVKFRDSIRRRIERGDLVDWSPSEQGLIFAAGSLGNLLIAIPLTRLGEIYGPKWIIFAASLGATLQAALMPLVAPAHVSLVILFQIVFNGLTFGADCVAYTLFAYWLTPNEMAFFVSCLLICYQMGTIMSSFVTSKILANGIAWSWCFYAPAILCGLWTLIWVLIGASEPSKSVLISKRELLFLLKSSKISTSFAPTAPPAMQNSNRLSDRSFHLSNQRQQLDTKTATQHHSQGISWLKLARDPNIWAIIAVKFTLRWYFSVYLSLMPTYLSSVAHMSVETIGEISVVQSFIGLLSGILMGYLTKSLVTRRPLGLSLATTRKFFQSIVNFGLALSLIVFIVYDCQQWVTIATLTIGGICINFYCAAALQLPLDLSPSHCGLITSISNTLALGQALGAPISGLILNNGPKDRALWRVVWLLAIILNTASGLVFIVLVDSKPRDYSKSPPTETTTTTAIPR